MKDKDELHFTLPFAVGGCTREFLLECLADYQVMACYIVTKDAQLQPDNFMRAVIEWLIRHAAPLDLHPLQVIRLLLLEKHYHLGEKWCTAGASLFSSRKRVCYS
jgi:hypothetical protein